MANSAESVELRTFDAAAFSSLGTARENVKLPTDLFDGTVNRSVMHQAVNAFLANQRQGNAKTKIRKYVTGGNQKPWKQKGTGRARQGSTRAPNWPGGGTVFGPIPRSYAQYVPRQVRALARKSALNARAAEGAVKVIDAFSYERPHTSRMFEMLGRLGLEGQKVLILTDGNKSNVYLSARNIPNVQVMAYSDVSTYHILWSDTVLIESSALGSPLTPLAEAAPAPKERRPQQAPVKKARKEAAPKTAEAKKPARRAAAKKTAKPKAPSAKKTVAKKAVAKKAAAKKPAAKKKGKK